MVFFNEALNELVCRDAREIKVDEPKGIDKGCLVLSDIGAGKVTLKVFGRNDVVRPAVFA